MFLCILQLAEDVICHKADLRFVTISGQKVLDSVQGALEKVGSTDPALEETRHLVSGKLQDATQRYSSLHSKVGPKQLCIPSVNNGLKTYWLLCVHSFSPQNLAPVSQVSWSDTNTTKMRLVLWAPGWALRSKIRVCLNPAESKRTLRHCSILSVLYRLDY